MNREQIEEYRIKNAGIAGSHELCDLALSALQPQGETVAYVWDEAAYPEGDVRGRGWREVMGRHHPNNHAMTRNVVPLSALQPLPADRTMEPKVLKGVRK